MALGPAIAAVLWDQRFAYHLQHYAESSPVDSFGFIAALGQLRNTLVWSGEIAAQIPPKTMALMGRLLQTEASTAAWQDFLLFNACLALLALLPTLLVDTTWWRHVWPSRSTTRPHMIPAKPAAKPRMRVRSRASANGSRGFATYGSVHGHRWQSVPIRRYVWHVSWASRDDGDGGDAARSPGPS
jgi:hypothetical protein